MSGELCEELIIEIFTRLPPKSLLRFRSLSKSICCYIHSPGFIRMHTSRSPQKLLISHYRKDKYNYYTYTSHSQDQLPLRTRCGYNGITAYNTCCVIAGSCNGILCLVDRKEYNIILWNPTIRRELTLPCCPGRNTSLCRRLYPYEFCWVGFGFDPVTDDYKIVSLPEKGGTGEASYVYTMKTGAWCAIASPTPSFYDVTSRGCFVNGALHWMVRDNPTADRRILTFNLSTHVFGMIESPAPIWEYEVLTTIKGSLAVISYNNQDDLWIWVMRRHDNTSSWSVVFKAKRNRVEGQVQTVLQPTNNGDLLYLPLYERWFEVYDLKIGARFRMQNMSALTSIFYMETFVESLQLLDVGTSCENGSKQSIHDGNWRSKRIGVLKKQKQKQKNKKRKTKHN